MIFVGMECKGLYYFLFRLVFGRIYGNFNLELRGSSYCYLWLEKGFLFFFSVVIVIVFWGRCIFFSGDFERNLKLRFFLWKREFFDFYWFFSLGRSRLRFAGCFEAFY